MMSKPDELDEILDDFLAGWSDGSDADENYRKLAKQRLLAWRDREIEKVIGEDEKHKDTSFGGSLPAFETEPMKHRNQLKAEQRDRIAQLKNKGEK